MTQGTGINMVYRSGSQPFLVFFLDIWSFTVPGSCGGLGDWGMTTGARSNISDMLPVTVNK